MINDLSKILSDKTFKDVEVLAGIGGLNNEVKRTSVFDCRCNKEFVMNGVLHEGDFFISCMEQFRNDRDNIHDFFDALIESGSSGLIVVGDQELDVLSPEIIERCNQNNYPLLLSRKEIPYATIIDVFNQYISIENTNSVNYMKLEKIVYGNMRNMEEMDILNSINPNVKQCIQVLFINGFFSTEWIKFKLYEEQLRESKDIFAWNGQTKILITSAENEKNLKNHVDAFYSMMKNSIPDVRIGSSQIHHKRNIKRAMDEGRYALQTANMANIQLQVYDPLSSLQLLLTIADSRELNDFYDAYVEALRRKVSQEGLSELLRTIDTYVLTAGNYKKTAQKMNQHENTIRYRINRAKEALDMEDDNIKFNETISIAAKIKMILRDEEEN